jgi:amino acid transporter
LIYAVGAVVVLSGLNLLGVRAGKWTQNLLTLVKFAGLLAIIAVGMRFSADRAPPADTPVPAEHSALPATSEPAPAGNLGLALILVILAYGGWNEMPYVSAEVRNPQKNILRALVLGTLAVAAVYIAVNLAFVHALGLAGLQQSKAVAADVLSLRIGPRAGNFISVLICITALGGINGMIFTGARILYALGTEHRFFTWLGQWSSRTDAPARPLIIQAAVSVALIIGFGWNRDAHGFENSVAFYSPSFWLFLYLVGHSLFVLRARSSGPARTYRVPFYPVVPLLFCLASAYMFFESLDYAFGQTPWGLAASGAVLGIGAILSFVE